MVSNTGSTSVSQTLAYSQKNTKKTSTFDCVTHNRIDTRGEGEQIALGKDWMTLSDYKHGRSFMAVL